MSDFGGRPMCAERRQEAVSTRQSYAISMGLGRNKGIIRTVLMKNEGGRLRIMTGTESFILKSCETVPLAVQNV